MSFGKLLATGKSFVGGRGADRYQMNPGVFLPKFISPRNPFSRPPENKAVAPAADLVKPVEPQQPLTSNADAVASEAPAAVPVQAVKRRSVMSMMWSCVKAVARFLNPLKLFRRRVRAPKSAIPRFDKKPVQAELSLERVQVMRNDLAESDLEVVTVGAASDADKRQPGDGAWSRLTDRVFGPETI